MAQGYRPFYVLNAVAGTAVGTPVDISGSIVSMAIQILITGTATVQLKGSQNNIDWVNVSDPQAGYTADTILVLDPKVAFYRADVTAYTSGSISAIVGHGLNRLNSLMNAGPTHTPEGIVIGSIDTSGLVPDSRVINTTPPLTGGGDLSADRTLGVTDFTALARGTVPASGGGSTNFLRADGTWNAPPSPLPGHVIKEDGTPYPQRTNLDFKSGFSLSDAAGDSATEVYLNLDDWFTAGGLVLVDGDNDNVSLPSTHYITITGPANPYALTGAVPTASGDMRVLFFNTVNPALPTIKNEDAGSLAANRINTGTGADIRMPVGLSMATIIHDGSRWRIVAVREIGASFLRTATVDIAIGEIVAPAVGDVLQADTLTSAAWAPVDTGNIADKAVTYAKFEDINNNSVLLGRGSAGGPGVMEQITLGTNLAIAGTVLNGTGVTNPLTANLDADQFTITDANILSATRQGVAAAAITGTADTLGAVGVVGISSAGTAVEGDTATGVGVIGAATGSAGIGVYGRAIGGESGLFQSDLEANTEPTLVTRRVSAGATAPLFEAQDHAGAEMLQIASDGDLSFIKGVDYDWPAADAAGVLTSDGAGALSWGAGGGGMTVQDQLDLSWQKKFWTDASLLPATERIAASLATVPTEAGVVAGGGGAFNKDLGRGELVNTSGGALAYWDLGALRSEVLVVIGGTTRVGNNGVGIGLTPGVPANQTADGYSSYWASVNANLNVFSWSGGAPTALGTAPANLQDGGARDQNVGIALYYKDSTDTIKTFAKIAGGWFLVNSVVNASAHTTVRYVSFRYDGGNETARLILPFVAWSD